MSSGYHAGISGIFGVCFYLAVLHLLFRDFELTLDLFLTLCTEMFKFEVPSLMVGTLDSLIVSSQSSCVHAKFIIFN